MANGDITKADEYDKIEIVNSWAVHLRKATKIMEEGSDGSLTEISRNFHRNVIYPCLSVKNNDDSWTHTATDISGEAASVQAIANAAWTDAVKAAYKTMREAQG